MGSSWCGAGLVRQTCVNSTTLHEAKRHDVRLVVVDERVLRRVVVKQVVNAHHLLEPVAPRLRSHDGISLSRKNLLSTLCRTYHVPDVVRAHDEHPLVCMYASQEPSRQK